MSRILFDDFDAPVTTMTVVDPPAETVQTGSPIQVAALFVDGETSTDVTTTATWSTSDASVATVVAGLITAVGPGSCVISAIYSGRSGDCTVTVQIPTPTGLDTTRSGIGFWSVTG